MMLNFFLVTDDLKLVQKRFDADADSDRKLFTTSQSTRKAKLVHYFLKNLFNML